MATLTPSALMVALVQTASTAPSLLFGLVAGSLADIVDRRRIILATQVLLLAATLILGIATLAGLTRAHAAAGDDVPDRRRVHVLHAGAAGQHQRLRVARRAAARRRARRRCVQRRARRRARARGRRGRVARHRQRADRQRAFLRADDRRGPPLEAARPGASRRSGNADLRRAERAALCAPLAPDALADHPQPEFLRMRELAVGAAPRDRARPAASGRRRLRPADGELRHRRRGRRAVDSTAVAEAVAARGGYVGRIAVDGRGIARSPSPTSRPSRSPGRSARASRGCASSRASRRERRAPRRPGCARAPSR